MNTIIIDPSGQNISVSSSSSSGVVVLTQTVGDDIQTVTINQGQQGPAGVSVVVGNYGNNRIPTSDGTAGGLYAESDLTFDGSKLRVSGIEVSLSGHTHSSNDIGNFNSTVSGLLPVTNISPGSGISVSSSSGNFIISVTGSFGLTSEEVDDRVANLLIAGSYINLNYSDSGNTLTISTSGLQPSGNYASSIHSHTTSDITNFSSGVSGLLPTISNSGNNRVLTSTGSSTGINAENNLTFDGTTLAITGILDIDNIRIDNNSIELINDGGLNGINIYGAGDALGQTLNIGLEGIIGTTKPGGFALSEFYVQTTGDRNLIIENVGNGFVNINGNLEIASSGNVLLSGNSIQVNSVEVSVSGHSHTASDITDFNSSVSGLLPVKNITAASGISIVSTTGNYTIGVSGLNSTYISDFNEAVDDRIGSGLFVAGTGINLNYNDASNSFTVSISGLVNNPTSNRLLTSRDSTTTGIDAETNLIFDETTLTVTGDVSANYYFGAFDGPIVYDCRNNTASTINKGTPVYVSGHYANGKVDIAPADASNSAKMPALGLLGETLTTGQEGHVHMFGALSNIDTSAYNDPTDIGKTLFVASGGGLTPTRPTGENILIQNIARIARISSSNGRLLVLGPARTNDVPNSINAYKLDIDNVRIDGSTISSIDGNSLNIFTGQAAADLRLGVEGINFANGYAEYYITTSGTTDLLFDTNGGVDTGYIRINSGLGQDVEIASSGNVLLNGTSVLVNGTEVSISGHAHTVSDITNFNSSVSGLLPTINNSGDNRILTSTGSSFGINAENNLTFNGSTLDLTGNANISGILTSTSGNITTLTTIPTSVSPSALSVSQGDWNPGAGDIIRLSASTTGINISGIVLGNEYMRILINVGSSNNITLKHQATSASSGNRIITSTGGDHVIQPTGTVAILYDTIDSRWRVL